jgi:hypothetical protein
MIQIDIVQFALSHLVKLLSMSNPLELPQSVGSSCSSFYHHHSPRLYHHHYQIMLHHLFFHQLLHHVACFTCSDIQKTIQPQRWLAESTPVATFASSSHSVLFINSVILQYVWNKLDDG